jgi:hypothetical protein
MSFQPDDAVAVRSALDPEFFGDSLLNNSSLVLWLEVPAGARNHRVLLAADQENWTYLCAQHPRGLHADVLKASHHGGRVYLERDLAFDTLLGAVRPRAVMISGNGRHGLPRDSFRSAAMTWGATVFCTSRRGTEVVISEKSGKDCCHDALGCTEKTRDVTIILDVEGIHSPDLACHSGWGGEPGPVVQVQQHIIAPSRIVSRLFEQELRRHLSWVSAKLAGIHQARRTQPAEGQRLDAVGQDTLLRLAREEDPPRYDLIAHLDTVLAEGMSRGKFWAVKADYGREWHAYALPTNEEVNSYLSNLGDVAVMVFPPLKDKLPGDYDTLLAQLDTERFIEQAGHLLHMPAEAFTEALWPRVSRELKRHWKCYELPGVRFIMSSQPPKQFYTRLLDQFVEVDESGRVTVSAERSKWPSGRFILLSGSEETEQIKAVLESLFMIRIGQLGSYAADLVEVLRQRQAAKYEDFVGQVREFVGMYSDWPEDCEEIMYRIVRNPDAEPNELWQCYAAYDDVMRATAPLQKGQLSITDALALPKTDRDRIAEMLAFQLRSLWQET